MTVRRVLLGCVLILLAFITFWTHVRVYKYQLQVVKHVPVTWPASVLRQMAFGYRNVLADLCLFQGLAYGHTHPEDWQYYYSQCDRATDIDPRFFYAYESGGLLLAWDYHQPAAANALLEKGVRHLPWQYQLALWRGFNAFYFQSDFETAAIYFGLAADRCPFAGTAEMLKQMQAKSVVYATLIDPTQAWQTVQALADRVNDASLKKMLLSDRPGFERRTWLMILNKQVRVFIDSRGRPPKDLQELKASRFLDKIPSNIWSMYFRYNVDGKRFE